MFCINSELNFSDIVLRKSHNDDLSLDISENDEKNSSCNENKRISK